MAARRARPRGKVNHDNMKPLLKMMEKEIGKRLSTLASAQATALRNDITSGMLPSGTRSNWGTGPSATGASAASIYHIKSDGSSNFDEQSSAFMAAMQKDEPYGGRTASEMNLGKFDMGAREPHRLKAMFGSMSLVVGWWEYGHTNKWTKQEESVPIVSWHAFVAAAKFREVFKNLL